MRVSDFSMLWTPKLDSVGSSYNGQLSCLHIGHGFLMWSLTDGTNHYSIAERGPLICNSQKHKAHRNPYNDGIQKKKLFQTCQAEKQPIFVYEGKWWCYKRMSHFSDLPMLNGMHRPETQTRKTTPLPDVWVVEHPSSLSTLLTRRLLVFPVEPSCPKLPLV